jgi:pyrroline-5-carboxylate reductase
MAQTDRGRIPGAVGFIGAGKMACALASGLVQAGLVRPESLWASDPSPEARQAFADCTGGRVTSDNALVATECSVLFLAVKPQQAPSVFEGFRQQLTPRHLVVSVMAGISLDQLQHGLGPGPRLCRVMPNTPYLVGFGASGYSLGRGALEEDANLLANCLGATGRACELPEYLLDAVTGLSGSGPAYVFLMIEALADGGVQAGLPRAVAMELAAQTVRGAAEMVLSMGQHPAVLKDQVASPGGTTIAGLAVLESAGVRGALIRAVETAARRAFELGQSRK